MKAVVSLAISSDLSVYFFSSSFYCCFFCFQHNESSSVTNCCTISFFIERFDCFFWVIVVCPTESFKLVHARKNILIAIKIYTSHNHSIHIPILNKSICLSNSDHTTNTSFVGRTNLSSNLVVDRNLTAEDVWHLLD